MAAEIRHTVSETKPVQLAGKSAISAKLPATSARSASNVRNKNNREHNQVNKTIGVTGHNDRGPMTVEVNDGNTFQKLTMEADSGTETSTIRESTFKDRFPNTLHRGTDRVQNYDRTPIKGIQGTFKATVRLFGRTHTDTRASGQVLEHHWPELPEPP